MGTLGLVLQAPMSSRVLVMMLLLKLPPPVLTLLLCFLQLFVPLLLLL